ncbi:MAG TPA: hypothetical protein VIJ92_13670 [Ginsengibacter sp.]
MSKSAKKKEKKIVKKNARKEAYDKLLTVFSDYKNGSDVKKFDSKLKKCAKLFAPFIIKAKSDIID